jgi:hypothetical protein
MYIYRISNAQPVIFYFHGLAFNLGFYKSRSIDSRREQRIAKSEQRREDGQSYANELEQEV